MHSEKNYIKVMEYADIAISHNKLKSKLFVLDSGNHKMPYVFCGFQYITSRQTLSSAFVTHYKISLMDNVIYVGTSTQREECMFSLYHHFSHCKWIPSSAFYNDKPGPINQQILQTIRPTGFHSAICYCLDNITNCSVDVLGSVYPGQLLQVDLCVSNTNESFILYAET